MGKPFSVNTNRYDPYKAYRFLVYFGTSRTAVAGVSKIGSLKRSSDVIEYKQGGDAIIVKGLGRTKYDAITLERGLTYDTDFQDWADATQKLDSGAATTSLLNLRKEIRIELLNEGGSRSIATRFTAAGCLSIRCSPIWTPVEQASRWNTSSSRTKAGNAMRR